MMLTNGMKAQNEHKTKIFQCRHAGVPSRVLGALET